MLCHTTAIPDNKAPVPNKTSERGPCAYTRVFTALQPPFLLRGGGEAGNEAGRDGAAHGRRGQVARVLVGEHAARGVAGREQAGDGLLHGGAEGVLRTAPGSVAQGRDYAQIEGELFVSHNTLKTHVHHIYAKTGVHSRRELLELFGM